MSNPGIFLIQPNDGLVEMNEQPYDAEERLQHWIAEHPSLLAGHQVDSDDPRKWILIKRECGVPSEDGAGGRWSIDHLFLDQDAIPTFVEVKRSSSTDIRRKIVGHMLDYAAHAVDHWPVSYMQDSFEETCEKHRRDSEEELTKLLGDDADHAEFWSKADKNLRDGNIRLMFVADKIPKELQRVVEFLNKRMHPTTVLALEIKQFIGAGQTGLVPRVIGKTTDPPPAPPSSTASPEEIVEAIAKKSVEYGRVAQEILDWSRESFTRIAAPGSSFVPELQYDGRTFSPIAVFKSKGGRLQVRFGHIRSRNKPFDTEEKRRELLDRLGVSLDNVDKFPSVSLGVLTDNAALHRFFKAIAWAIEEVKVAHNNNS